VASHCLMPDCHLLMPQCLTALPKASPPDGTASNLQQEISVGSIVYTLLVVLSLESVGWCVMTVPLRMLSMPMSMYH
jgi:hypothetical protein